MRIREIALALPVVLGLAACSTAGTQGSRTASTDRGTAPGDAQASAQTGVRAHAGDQLITGAISRVTPDALTITTQDGTEKTLSLVPQTSVTIDGEDSDRTALVEGLPVRASFDTIENQDVAVHIMAVRSPETTGPSLDPGAAGGGTNGSQSSGQSQGSLPDDTTKTPAPH